MGGSVAFTIREANGTEHRMCRWTNILPWAVLNNKTFTKSAKHVREILTEWDKMRADYLAHEEDGQFQFPMSPCYGDHPLLAPISYGLVVVDMQKDVILTMQGYTSFDNLHCYSFDRDEDRFFEIKAMFGAKRIKNYIMIQKGEMVLTPVPKTWDAFIAQHQELLLREKRSVDGYYYGVTVDPRPFTIEKFPESAEGVRNMRARVLELGFVLTPVEEAAWAEFEKQFEGREGEIEL